MDAMCIMRINWSNFFSNGTLICCGFLVRNYSALAKSFYGT